MKNLIITVLFSLSGVATFAAANGSEGSSSTLSYVAVAGFFTLLVTLLVLPLNKGNIKSILG